jgi:hypothetical protein
MSQNQPLKRVNLTICSLVLLSACQTSSNAGSTIESYLKAVDRGNTQEQQDLRCVTETSFPDKAMLGEMRKWKILSQKQKVHKDDPEAQYVEVSARIESMSSKGFPVTHTWIFEVWKPDELHEHQKRYIAKTNQLMVDTRKTTNEIKSAKGEAIDPSPSSLRPPKRSEMSSRPYCLGGFEIPKGYTSPFPDSVPLEEK